MDQSKIDAADVVLTELEDYPKDHGPGALIEQTSRGARPTASCSRAT